MKLRQPLKGAAAKLFEYAQDVPVIDTHEHIPATERDYLKRPVTFQSMFQPYLQHDFASAGLADFRSPEFSLGRSRDDWDRVQPYWDAVKHGSYARPLRIALQHFYGCDDLTKDNFLDILERVNAQNTPGIYERIFRQACGIETVIPNSNFPDPGDTLMRANPLSPSVWADNRRSIEKLTRYTGVPVKTLEDLVTAADRCLEMDTQAGAVAFKVKTHPIEAPSEDLARQALQAHLADQPAPGDWTRHLRMYLRETHARKAAGLGVPLTIHTGVWGDFRSGDVKNIIGFIARNPDTRIAVYHMSIPSTRDCMMVIKNFPNAYMDLCWAHIVSPEMVAQSLRETVDLVPMNKIFAFGADYSGFIQRVYGHLWMARENIAIVLGERVERNLMDLDEAKAVLKAWFYDNPKVFYRL